MYHWNAWKTAAYGSFDKFVKEDLWELGVGQRKSPKTKIRGGVGDTAKNVFYGFDELMDEYFATGLVLVAASIHYLTPLITLSFFKVLPAQ